MTDDSYGRRTRPDELPALRSAIAAAERAIVAHVQRTIPGAGVISLGAVDLYPGTLAFWVTTPTDAQRDALLADQAGFEATLREIVRASGYPEDAVPLVGFTAESEETVERNYNGNWYHAMK